MRCDITKLIEEGKNIMMENPRRDLTTADLYKLNELATDQIRHMSNAFLAGVAMGVRIAKASTRK